MTIDLTSYFCLLENFASSKPAGYSGVKFSAGVELFCQIYFSKVSNTKVINLLPCKMCRKIAANSHFINKAILWKSKKQQNQWFERVHSFTKILSE